MIKQYRRQIIIKKIILNFLLNYLSPTNKFIVYLSQNLDKLISKSQKNIYIKYTKKHLRSNSYEDII